jgi:hypothetical protein
MQKTAQDIMLVTAYLIYGPPKKKQPARKAIAQSQPAQKSVVSKEAPKPERPVEQAEVEGISAAAKDPETSKGLETSLEVIPLENQDTTVPSQSSPVSATPTGFELVPLERLPIPKSPVLELPSLPIDVAVPKELVPSTLDLAQAENTRAIVPFMMEGAAPNPAEPPPIAKSPFIPEAAAVVHKTPEILKPLGITTSAVAGLVSFLGVMGIYNFIRGVRRSSEEKETTRQRRHVRDWNLSIE